ncbi:hypothetical protein C667_08780 [Thauera phenylacetica B4P]|uniref:DUF1468 domain-containing protein n=1 Tax=Thauera phenylacetica B4P TaxID=1234382 RepID=N6ZT27_9RHOO|nr:tripartite tricarboxylate transporter TctB family protein [Thauera phenylacetica]ENO97458.1 hypothetical protein C667_08780 [Thauera phenylacetica B4P]
MSTRRQRLPGELAFTVLLLALSLFMVWQAYEISGFSSITSAGVFPLAATATMVVAMLRILVPALRAPAEPAAAGESRTEHFVRRLVPGALVLFTLATAAYMFALERIGFVASSYAFLVVSMFLLGSRRLGLNLVVSAVALAVIYVVFRTVFEVVLPTGSLLQGVLK